MLTAFRTLLDRYRIRRAYHQMNGIEWMVIAPSDLPTEAARLAAEQRMEEVMAAYKDGNNPEPLRDPEPTFAAALLAEWERRPRTLEQGAQSLADAARKAMDREKAVS